MSDLKLQIALITLVVLAFLAGFIIYRKVSETRVPPQGDMFETISLATPSPIPSPSTKMPEAIRQATASATTKGGQTLPATGMPIVLVGVFAGAAVASGFFLRKFPE